MEFIAAASFVEVQRRKYYSPNLFENRDKHEWSKPPPLHHNVPCVVTTETYEVNRKDVVYITGNREL